ncbi:MAG: type III secretion T3S chaperone [Waddliaceae bacterium]
MATKIEYPLEKVLEVKVKRVEDQERVVKVKLKELEQEEEKLKICEEKRNKVFQHLQEKYNQLREEIDGGTTSPKVLQMKFYIKDVQEKLEVEEKKVKDQKEEVVKAEQALKEAKDELARKRREVDKLKIHRDDWMKERKLEIAKELEKEMDEIGNITYQLHMRKR